MYKHILLPTDGSAQSRAVARRGINLARAMDARVAGLHVASPFRATTYRTNVLEEMRAEYEEESAGESARYLAFVSELAAGSGVVCDTLTESHDDVCQSIIDVARARACDLIAMAPHGRLGIAGLLLGSDTGAVLAQSDISVLVCR